MALFYPKRRHLRLCLSTFFFTKIIIIMRTSFRLIVACLVASSWLAISTVQAQYFTYKGLPLAAEQRVMLAQDKPLTWAYRYPAAPISVALAVSFNEEGLTDDEALHLSWGEAPQQTLTIRLSDMSAVAQPDPHGFGDYVDYYSHQEDAAVTKTLRFRYLNGAVYLIAMGELGGDYLRKIGEADHFNFTLTARTRRDVVVNYSIPEYDMPSMTVLANGGLRMRAAPDLNSETLALIPDGTAVMVADAEHMAHIYYEQQPSTQGTLAVGEMKSKMMPVFYNGQLGYVYGGYLFPVYPESPDYGLDWFQGFNAQFCYDRELRMNDPTSGEITAYQRQFSIDFRHPAAQGMALSQRAYLLKRLLPDIWELDALYKMLNDPTSVALVKRDGKTAQYKASARARLAGLEGRYTLYFEKGKPVRLDFESDRADRRLPYTATRYVSASTLNMRTDLDAKSDILTKIPFGESVQLLNRPGSAFQVIGGVRGRMVWVSYNGQEGAVFDAYLSPIAPSQIFEDLFNSSEELWITAYSLNSEQVKAFDDETLYIGNGDVFMAHDLHQLIKIFRQRFPMLEEVSMQYDTSRGGYTIRSNTPKVKYERVGNYHFFKLNAPMMPVIVLQDLGEELWFVTITVLESGC